MSQRFKIKPLTLSMLSILFAASTQTALAAEAEKDEKEQAKKSDEAEVIEVTGYRGSVLKSIFEKRNAQGIVDSIFAEDIGKNTDQNIADALSRVTGVTVQSEDGEGTVITVRGANPDMNNIQLNGITLTSADPNQSVDLSAFSSDILSSINVYKTAAADHDEGSLGATVVLNTAKPLNQAKERTNVEIQGRYNDLAGAADRKISGSISRKFFDETLGVIVTASDEIDNVRKDQIGGDWLTPYQVKKVRAGGARDLDGNIIEDESYAIIRKSISYELHRNQRKRQTVNLGLQFLPTENSDLQLDLTYTKQEVQRDNHKVGVNAPNTSNADYENLETDPQHDWWVINTDSHTLVKSLNRYGGGSFGRNRGGDLNKTKGATLSFSQYITDDIKVDLKAGIMRTEFESLPNSNVNTANWGTIPRPVLEKTPLELLEPVGYDCTGGQKCQFVTSTQDYIYVPGGNNDNESNIATGGFNPLDPYASHVGYVASSDNKTIDTNKTLFLDVDWNLDVAGINKLEFGVKVSQRDKDVYTGYQQFQGADQTVFDKEGKPVSGQSTADIYVVDILDDGDLPVDNFMENLVGSRPEYSDEFLKGWGLIDSKKAFDEIFGLKDFSIKVDESQSRNTIQDNYSAYTKLNFSYLNDRLTGNVGVRFVHTEVESPIGVSTMKFFDGDRIFTAHELIANGLFDDSNPACPSNSGANREIRIDGTYTLSGNEIFDDTPVESPEDYLQAGDTVPNLYPCYEPFIAEITDKADKTNSFLNYDVPVPTTHEGRSWWQNYRHTDISTQRRFNDGRDQRLYSSSGQGESDLWLPSLNLNYAVNEKLIARFAVSKTMTRPNFDDLRPGWSFNENVWGDFSRMSAPNPKLKPLTSRNLDLSLEWYFDQSGQLSLALFDKDMKNFIETIESDFYVRDVRYDTGITALDIDEVLLPYNEEYKAGMDLTNVGGESVQCMPDRIVQDKLKNSFTLGCEPVRVVAKRNGKTAYTRGIELAYLQSFDFLPGELSGLGVNFNYTYQESGTEAENFSLGGIDTGKKLKPLPLPFTPKHTTNTAVYWEKYGHSMKFTYRYNSIQLVDRGPAGGANWQDAKGSLDFSAVYKLRDNIAITFNALNLTDENIRTFFTSNDLDLGLTDADGNAIPYDEGNPMDDSSVDTSRTVQEYRVGKRYRLGVRIDF
ncbi:TonB-dependent receptor [Catenovulum agarivorans DS-2]|uniref:TonB-dependent receptor n=1 Tax=Catenovulum agarivorans DS-2 TaxID=1328313 RepID=W7QAD3_9ALTE|nr:TonB-dependent receptor [Catenovulum agarivorans]EWH08971.1 TonB-dependent receptor [Catenovulum agarivorans DS-2]